MDENIIANATYRILILNCPGEEMSRKNNTRCNSNDGKSLCAESRYVTLTHRDIRTKGLTYFTCQIFLIIVR